MTSVKNYPDISPVSAGIKGRCPRCGEGKIFRHVLGFRKQCDVCGLDFSFADTADGPAVFAMFIMGFAIVGAALAVEIAFMPPYWVHLVLWVPATFLLALVLLRPIKGALMAQQYKHDAQEGRLTHS